MCKDFDWRKTLKIGDVIDVSDTANVWYNATVLKTFEEVDEDTGIKVFEVYIGKFCVWILLNISRLPGLHRKRQQTR